MRQPRTLGILYVNGYDIPPDLRDGNYQRYLSRFMFDNMDLGKGNPVLVVLAGGATYTECPEQTEARYMLQWMTAHQGAILHRFTFRLLEEGCDVETNLRGLRRICQELDLPAVTLYCEWARQDWFRFLVYRLIPNAAVVPVVFDQGHDPHFRLRIKMLVKLPWRILTWYWRIYRVSPHTFEPARS